jgi:hypothetical protein
MTGKFPWTEVLSPNTPLFLNDRPIACSWYIKNRKNCVETVCASSLAMCAYLIGEHLHLTFADHLDLYSQQANSNFRFRSEQIPQIFPLSVCKENRAVFPFCRKIWWQSSKAFQEVNYVTCSLVLRKYRFGVICTKMLQIQRKMCYISK